MLHSVLLSGLLGCSCLNFYKVPPVQFCCSGIFVSLILSRAEALCNLVDSLGFFSAPSGNPDSTTWLIYEMFLKCVVTTPEQLLRGLLPKLNHQDSINKIKTLKRNLWSEQIFTIEFMRSQVSSYFLSLMLLFWNVTFHVQNEPFSIPSCLSLWGGWISKHSGEEQNCHNGVHSSN